jgi:hypothetical protein
MSLPNVAHEYRSQVRAILLFAEDDVKVTLIG